MDRNNMKLEKKKALACIYMHLNDHKNAKWSIRTKCLY